MNGNNNRTGDSRSQRTQVTVLFMAITIVFTVCLIASNILETKQMVFGPLHLTGGLLIFPISYIVNDVVCEVWGYRKASIIIWTGFLTITIRVVKRVKAYEGVDVYDTDISYNIFAIFKKK